MKLFFDDLGKAITQGLKSMASQITGGAGGGMGSGIFSGLGKWLGGLFGGGEDWSGYGVTGADAHGNAYYHGLRAFAAGGIVTRPTLFPMARGLGLAGEAGYEGILPLSRVGGDLGVKALFPGPAKVEVINNLGVQADPKVSQGDAGEIRITLEREIAGMVARGGPLANLIKMLRY